MKDHTIAYIGEELELFREARRWKNYWGSKLQPYVRGIVGEVGAGLGCSTEYLLNDAATEWHFIEPDPVMSALLRSSPPACLGSRCSVTHTCTLEGLDSQQRFDTLIYIDVLEHLESDAGEIDRAFSMLNPGGRILALSPAHPSLYSSFDKAVGHYRRYTKEQFSLLFQARGVIEKIGHLDAPGTMLSLANRCLLRRGNPTLDQIRFWDRWVIPIARVIDPLVAHSFGRSVYCIAYV
ncbi:MAG: class I SAM-dependent methyltransferase [Verrucomicrobia bacterium]|jgi:hypothetical protein|nr:class I SAM-dependent methyltransferase [Verrucomicrobiota bacterium]